jgi:hypothetical protein
MANAKLNCYTPIVGTQTPNANGQVSSDSATVPANLAVNGQTNPIGVEDFNEIVVGINIGAPSGTTPSATFVLEWTPDKGTTWFPVATSAAQTAAGIVTIAAGLGSANGPFGYFVRLRWTITGTAGPTFPVTAWLFGK